MTQNSRTCILELYLSKSPIFHIRDPFKNYQKSPISIKKKYFFWLSQLKILICV